MTREQVNNEQRSDRWRVRLHRLGKHSWKDERWVGWDGTPFSMDPVHGYRHCRVCGKRQKYHFDSQGGWWETVPS